VRSYLIGLLAIAAPLGFLALLKPPASESPEERRAVASGRTVITYWDRHSGHEHEARCVLIDEFNRLQDDVFVRALPIGYNIEKLLTAIAGGSPPDLCSLESTVLISLAPQGCFRCLDDFMAQSPHLKKERFFPHTWEAISYKGRAYGIPTTTDAFCLLWNKDAFRRAGLDPERPPRTLAELEDFAARLTVRGNKGIEQLGFLPWLPWDLTHMWGGLFGGRWFDNITGLAVCGNNQRIVESFAWQRSFTLDPNAKTQKAFAMDPTKIAAFRSGFGAYMSASNPFYTGKVAMIAEGEWQVTFIPKYAPELDWGVAALPQPQGAEPRCYSPSCVLDAIPAGSPHPDAAWAFLQWFYTPRSDGRPSPATDYCAMISNIPCRPEDAKDHRFMGNPKFRVFVEELLTKPVVTYPVTPAAQFMLDQIERQREYVVFRETAPGEAAERLENDTNREIMRIRSLLDRTRQ